MPRRDVIWINGAFGAGKTTVAQALARELPGSLLFDPEQVGTLVEAAVPKAMRPSKDFQDVPLWRGLTRATIAGLQETGSGPLIVPMTLVNPQYFDEIVGELRRAGSTVHHFALVASVPTLRKRLLTRLIRPQSTIWAWQQAERCAAALQSPIFDVRIPTDGMSVAMVVSAIRRAAGL